MVAAADPAFIGFDPQICTETDKNQIFDLKIYLTLRIPVVLRSCSVFQPPKSSVKTTFAPRVAGI
jgi:hypothetical protein